ERWPVQLRAHPLCSALVHTVAAPCPRSTWGQPRSVPAVRPGPVEPGRQHRPPSGWKLESDTVLSLLAAGARKRRLRLRSDLTAAIPLRQRAHSASELDENGP